MLKLKVQYFGHLMRRADSVEKTLMLGKIEGGGEGDAEEEMVDGITDSVDTGLNKLQGTVKDGEPGVLQSLGLQRVGRDLVGEQQQQPGRVGPRLQASPGVTPGQRRARVVTRRPRPRAWLYVGGVYSWAASPPAWREGVGARLLGRRPCSTWWRGGLGTRRALALGLRLVEGGEAAAGRLGAL